VPHLDEEGAKLTSIDPTTNFGSFDAVIIVTDHTLLDRERLVREAVLVVDTRDALRGIAGDRGKVYGL
jgi:UDP-N-acetyl-D-glucosamine dehydrogenase